MVSLGGFFEVPSSLWAVQSAYDVVLEQNKCVLLSMTGILQNEHYDGTFLLVSASRKFLIRTRQFCSLFGAQILVAISVLTHWSCLQGENAIQPVRMTSL